MILLLFELLCLLRANAWELNMERTPLLVLTFDPDTSAHCLGETATEVETKSGTADLAGVGVIDTVELLE
jgi:hypothetical protein